MNRDLFLSILAMDSYNRGYGRGIAGLDESGTIGAANVREFGLGEQDGWEAAGFYAIAYEWNGETIISYRGTDRNKISLLGDEGSDLVQGYGLALGNYLAPQATLAIDFYQAVAGDGANPFAANIATTGHSLGGGLAGTSKNLLVTYSSSPT